LESFLEVVQADLVAAPERPIPFHGPSTSSAGFIVGELKIFVEVGGARFRPEGHILEEACQVAAVEELIARTGSEGGAQLQVLEGILFEIRRREPIQTFREEEVKLDGAAAVPYDQVLGVIAVDVPSEDRQAQ
jgi:hypothetical protein